MVGKMTSRIACCVTGCANSTTKISNLKLFVLPSNWKRRRRWLQLICRQELMDKDPHNYRVCEVHFEPHYIYTLSTSKRTMLKKCALPTYFLPEERSGAHCVTANETQRELETETPAEEETQSTPETKSVAVQTERPVNPRYGGDGEELRPSDAFERFLEDCDYFLSKDLSKFIREQTDCHYRKEKVAKERKRRKNIEPVYRPSTTTSSIIHPTAVCSTVIQPKGPTDSSIDRTAVTEFHNALITEVKKHPCLYDHLNPAYDNVLIKGHIWVEIAKTIGSTETICQTRWASIYNKYMNSLTNQSIPYVGPDVYFLDPFIKNQEKETYIVHVQEKAVDPLNYCEIKTEIDPEGNASNLENSMTEISVYTNDDTEGTASKKKSGKNVINVAEIIIPVASASRTDAEIDDNNDNREITGNNVVIIKEEMTERITRGE